MYSVGVRPSYKTGFAQWPGMSEYPQLWKGLVGAWDMSLGQTGNKKVFDLSGNGNHATLVNATWVAGKYGYCIEFDGSTTVMSVADSNLIEGMNKLTISLWVWAPSGVQADDWASVYKKANNIYICIQNGNSNQLFWGVTTGGGFVGGAGSNTSIWDGNWHMLTLVYNGVAVKAYIDGVLDFSGAQTGTLTTSVNPWYIGNEDGTDNFFAGKIAQILMHRNRALSISEITLLYQLKMRQA